MKTLHIVLLVSLFAASILISAFARLGAKQRGRCLGRLFLSGAGGGVSALMAVCCLIALLFSGCAATPPPSPSVVRVIDTACKWVPALTASPHDTSETKREILAYEKTRHLNCPGASLATAGAPG